MPQASQVILNEIDLTFAPSNVILGVSGLVGKFKRGPINDPSTIMNSWAQFQKLFGGFVTGVDDAVIARRAFNRGTSLRVVNLGHYTDITNIATLDATKAINATTVILTANGPLITGNTITVTINTTNTVPQVFTLNDTNTWQLLAAKIVTLFPNLVQRAIYMGAEKIILVPQTGITPAKLVDR